MEHAVEVHPWEISEKRLYMYSVTDSIIFKGKKHAEEMFTSIVRQIFKFFFFNGKTRLY